MARSVYYQFGMVCQLQVFLDWGDLTCITHAMVTSIFKYCKVLYVGLPLEITEKLKLVQNSAA